MPFPLGPGVLPLMDMSLLTFLHLRELSLQNTMTQHLLLDETHFPQLRSLLVWGTQELELQLQLPRLLNLNLGDVVLESVAALGACLSRTACPRLRSFSAYVVCFSDSMLPRELVLDMPWIEHFKLQLSEVTGLELRAPRLMELHLINCSRLENVTLLPDGEPPVPDAVADAADAAAVLPPSVSIQSPEQLQMAKGALEDIKQARVCVPCAAKRIDVKLYDRGCFGRIIDSAWCNDSRVRRLQKSPSV